MNAYPENPAVAPDGSVYAGAAFGNNASVVTTAGTKVNIPLGESSRFSAANPVLPFAYFSTPTGVAVVLTSTNARVTTISVSGTPKGMAVTPDGTRLYVARDDGNVSVIDTVTNTVIGSPIAVGSAPWTVAIRPDGKRAFVTNSGDGTVSVINTDPASGGAYNTVVTTVTVGSYPTNLAVNASRVYVANFGGGTISVFNAVDNQFVATIPYATLQGMPFGVALSTDGTLLYTNLQQPNGYSNNVVAVIDTSGFVRLGTIDPGSTFVGVYGMATSPDGTFLWVAASDGGSGKVWRIVPAL